MALLVVEKKGGGCLACPKAGVAVDLETPCVAKQIKSTA